MKKRVQVLTVSGLLVWSVAVQAEQLVIPYVFTPGTPAKANEVNVDFEEIYTRINDIDLVLRVDDNEYVGIGTLTPTEKLDVAGKVKGQQLQVTNGATTGHVLTSDAVGNATWQSPAPDADNDPANEIQSLNLSGNNLSLSKVTGWVTLDDNDPGNELNSNMSVSGTTLSIIDSGGAKSVDLAEVLLFNNLADGKDDGSSLFLGEGSGANDDGGNFNFGIGRSSLGLNTTGSNNSGIGNFAMGMNTTGSNNVAVGNGSLGQNTTGANNVAIGINAAGQNLTGSSNTAVGKESLGHNTTGLQNVGVGYHANYQNLGGSFNTIIGYEAGGDPSQPLHDKSGNIFIGYKAGYYETGDDKLYIDNSDTETPLIYGDFAANSLIVNGSLISTGLLTTNGIASPTGNLTTNGSILAVGNIVTDQDIFAGGGLQVTGNAGIGTTSVVGVQLKVEGINRSYAGFFNTDNDIVTNGTGVYGLSSGSNGIVHTGVQGGAQGAATNTGVSGNAGDVDSTTNYGVYGTANWGNIAYGVYGYAGAGAINYGVYGTTTGTDDNSWAGFFQGRIGATSQLTTSSDQRLKENVRPVEEALDKIAAINGVYYNRIDTPEISEIGVIAQNVQGILPEAVSVIDPQNGYLGVSYPSLIPVLIEAVKEQQAQIAALQTRNEALERFVCQAHPEAGLCQ